jgi:transposase
VPAGIPVCYLDESGIDQYYGREKARAPRGTPVFDDRPGRKYARVNIVSALIGNRPIAPLVYTRTTNSALFESWFHFYLCVALSEPTVIVMDNASFHRKGILEQIAALHHHRILWLPAYSPDKNPIERYWANLKRWLRASSRDFPTIQAALECYLTSKRYGGC